MYYDDAYNRGWFAPSNLTCSGTPGTVIDLKQGINLAPDGSAGVDPAKMPRHMVKGVCVPVLPHDMIRVNTVFEVVKSAHMRTAFSEKRPAYDFLNGPSGHGVDDLYTPEIACFPFTPPATCTNALLSILGTQNFDELRVKSVLNEIDGKDHTGTQNAETPALFGMNFQAVNAAKKDSLLPKVGGYQDDYKRAERGPRGRHRIRGRGHWKDGSGAGGSPPHGIYRHHHHRQTWRNFPRPEQALRGIDQRNTEATHPSRESPRLSPPS